MEEVYPEYQFREQEQEYHWGWQLGGLDEQGQDLNWELERRTPPPPYEP